MSWHSVGPQEMLVLSPLLFFFGISSDVFMISTVRSLLCAWVTERLRGIAPDSVTQVPGGGWGKLAPSQYHF